MARWRRPATACALACLAFAAVTAAAWGGRVGVTRLVSVGEFGGAGDGPSRAASVAAYDARIAFASEASDLLPGGADTNGVSDIFVRDLGAGTTQRVSLTSDGHQADGPSYSPVLSGDGRYVAFESDATNLVAGDTNGVRDVFVRDTVDGATFRASVSDDEKQSNGASWGASMPYSTNNVAFTSVASNLVGTRDGNNVSDVFMRDWVTDETIRVSETTAGQNPNGASYDAAYSGDNEYVAFASDATNFVRDENGVTDVFLWHRSDRVVTRASVGPGGSEANGASRDPAMGPDDAFVVYTSLATNLVCVDPACVTPRDNNAFPDVYVRDLLNELTDLVSVTADGRAASGTSRSSAVSYAPYTVYGAFPPATPQEVIDALRPVIDLVPTTVVAFTSDAPDLVRGDLDRDEDTNGVDDVFLRDLGGQYTQRISVGSTNEQGDGPSYGAALSSDSSLIAFSSEATVFEVADANGVVDVYVNERRLCQGRPETGPVTGSVHESVEPLSGRLAPVVHEVSCGLADEGL
jgi:hypothetical protein